MSKHTPGPWRWELNLASKCVRLCGGKIKFDMNVMDFVRYGMSNAAPRFSLERRENLHLMTRADELGSVVSGREHHSEWFQSVNHPDAHLIAAAPDLLEALEEIVINAHKNYEGSMDIYPEAIEQAREVIKKAKGE